MAIDFRKFPQLAGDGYEVTSPHDVNYNCIAFAAGVVDVWWDPLDRDGYYWPDDLPGDDCIDTLIMLYEGLGYDLCEDGSLDAKVEKVALFAIGNLYTHAARQLPDGQWTSKLGKAEDIKHPRPESVAGDLYGRVVHFLERPRRSTLGES
ncbi:MAG: hypothetical protein WD669_08175 [Pirellulales bacterium]